MSLSGLSMLDQPLCPSGGGAWSSGCKGPLVRRTSEGPRLTANHVNATQRAVRPEPPQNPRPMLLQPPLRERVRRRVRLPKHPLLQLHARGLPARHGAPHALERGAEAALAEPREVVRGGPEEVLVGEVEGRLAVLLVAAVGEGGVAVAGGERAEVAGVGEEEVEDQLGVEGPVAGVVVDEDGVDLEGVIGRWGVILGGGGGRGGGGEVRGAGEGARVRVVVGEEGAGEGPDGGVGGVDVGGGEDVGEAVSATFF